MELGLSLGESASSPFMLFPKQQQQQQHSMSNGNILIKKSEKICGLGLGICMGLGINSTDLKPQEQKESKENDDVDAMDDDHTSEEEEEEELNGDDHRDVACLQQLDLLPPLPVPRWSSHNGRSRSSGKGFNVNSSLLQLGGGGGAAVAGEVTSANSVNVSSARFPMDFDIFRSGGSGNLSNGGGGEGKDDDEDETYINILNAKKKLRLSKEQSAYLEESFKEHHTLNPKQKLALAKQLNLRPRQIEVWFQNRRARTKLKQTEVDCEYLKRCCETLTEENKRLHKELQELRVLKISNPFYMQVPATTLTMCSSCEKVTTTTTSTPPPPPTTTNHTAATNPITTTNTTTKALPFPLSRSTRLYHFSQTTTNHHPHESATS